MRLYRSNAASLIRILFGIELVEGLRGYPETEGLAAGLEAKNEELDQALARRLAAHRLLAKARARRRIGEHRIDALLRQSSRAIELADGGRRGPLYAWLLPDGISPLVAAVSQAQLDAMAGLLERMALCRLAGAEALVGEWKPRLEAGQAAFQELLTAFLTAQKAYFDAFHLEQALRQEHELAVTKLKGLVQAAFPRDRPRQEAVWPQGESRSTGDVVDEDEPGEVEDGTADAVPPVS